MSFSFRSLRGCVQSVWDRRDPVGAEVGLPGAVQVLNLPPWLCCPSRTAMDATSGPASLINGPTMARDFDRAARVVTVQPVYRLHCDNPGCTVESSGVPDGTRPPKARPSRRPWAP